MDIALDTAFQKDNFLDFIMMVKVCLQYRQAAKKR